MLIKISGNKITNIRSTGGDGIYCFDIMTYDVSYNEAIGVPDYGLYISDGNFDNTPTSRAKIYNNMISSKSDYGFYLDDIEDNPYAATVLRGRHRSQSGGAAGWCQ